MDLVLFINLIGWVGSAAVLLAYVLVSVNRVKGDSIPYQLMNLVGSVFLLSNTLYWGAYPSSFVNFVWMGIALVAIARAVKR